MILFEMINNIDIGIDFIDNIINNTTEFFKDVEQVTKDEVSKASSQHPEIGTSSIFSKMFDTTFMIIGLVAFVFILIFFGWAILLFLLKGFIYLIYKMYKKRKKEQKKNNS